MCTARDIHAHDQFGLAFCTGLLQTLAEHSAEKGTLALAVMQWLPFTHSGLLQMHTGLTRIAR